MWKSFLRAGFDYVLIGEVEDTLLELVTNHSVDDIPGLAYISPESGSGSS